MKKFNFVFALAMLIALTFSSSYGQKLDEKLKMLEPFINKTWEANIPRFGEDAKQVVKWEIICNGKVIKKTGELKMINSLFEAYYFWDSEKMEIGFFSIHSNGNFANGHLKEDNGKIITYGFTTFPDKKLEFKNTLEFTKDNKFRDKYFRVEDGEWKDGHSRVFTEVKE